MVLMMYLWSRLHILVLVYLDKKVWELYKLVTMLYLNLGCYGDYCWYMEDGIILELLRWFCTSSTKICCLRYPSLYLLSIVDSQLKLSLMITISHSTIYCSLRFLLLLELSSSRMSTLLDLQQRKKEKLVWCLKADKVSKKPCRK